MKNNTSISDLESFFGQAVSEVFPEEGTCVFNLSKMDVKLTIVINEVVPSFITSMTMNNGEEMRMEFDGLEEISILTDKVGPYLLASFAVPDGVQCLVRVIPIFSVRWSFLR